MTAGAHLALAGTPSISLSSGSGAPGANVTLSVTLASNGGTQPAGVQWDFLYSSADINPGSGTFYTTGAAANAAGKQTSCNVVSPGDVRCLVVGLNTNVMGDGVLATVTFQIASTTTQTSTPITFAGVSGTDASANSIAMTGTGATVTINQPVVPTVSNLTCSPASITPPSSSTCTITLSSAVTSSTNITVSSSSSYATVVSPVTITSGSSKTFSVNAPSAVPSTTSSTITGTLNSSSKTFVLGLNAVTQPGVSSVSCTPSTLTGGVGTNCTVTLASAAPAGGTTVALSSNNAYATPPAQVTVAAGQTNTGFTVSTAVVTATQTSTITATSAGVQKSTTLTIQPPPLPTVSNLTCSPASITPPSSSTCTVTLSAAVTGSTSITVSSSSSYATVVSPVTITSGSSKTFAVTAPNPVPSTTSSTIMASLNGSSKTFTLGLAAAAQPTVSSVTCTPSTLTGGASTSCTVSLTSAAPAGGLNVTLSSNNAYAVPPGQVNVPAGQTSAGFAVSTTTVTANQTSTISATAAGVTQSTTLTIQPTGGGIGVASLACNPASIGSGASSNCTVTLTANAPSGGITVALSSGSPSVTVPGSVFIPSGSNSAAFTATAGTVGANLSAVLTATVSSSNTTFSLNVTGPAAVSSVSCTPQTIAPGAWSTCTVSLTSAVLSGNLEVPLTSSNPSVTVPGSVVIQAGNTSATFNATVAAGAANGTSVVAAGAGASTHTTTLTIDRNANSPTLACTPSTVQTPGTATCTFRLSSPALSTLFVALSSSSTSVTMPPSITIAAGTTSATFTATAASVASDTTVSVAANGQGATTTLTLLAPPTEVSLSSMSCSPQTLTGGGSVACQLMLSGAAPAAGVSIQLASSSAQVSIPASVQAAGSNTASFSVTSLLIQKDETLTLTANLGKSSAQTTVALVGLRPTAFSCSPGNMRSGLTASCQVTLNSTQVAGAVSVFLSSSDPHVVVPASVSSQPGQGTVAFQASTGFVPLSQAITLNATCNGFTVHTVLNLTPAPPALTVPGKQTVYPEKNLKFTVSANDPAGLAVSLSASNLPPNAVFNPNGGVFVWTPQDSQVGLYTVHITATNIAMVSETQDVVIEVASTTPVVFSVANAASYVDDGCSPGAAATILGTGFAQLGSQAAASTSPLPTNVDGVRVRINGQYVPVYYASEGQVNFQCPVLSPGNTVQLTIEGSTGVSKTVSSTMHFATPGIFAIDGSGKGQGAILIANTNQLAMTPTNGIPSRPAKPGDYISIYATGLGPVNVNVPAGSPAPAKPLANAQAQVDVKIDGSPGKVAFAGLAPGFIGLYQVNAEIPASAAAGDAIPVQIAVHLPDGSIAESNIVTIAVAPPSN